MTLALLDRSAPRSDQADLLAHRLDAMRNGRAIFLEPEVLEYAFTFNTGLRLTFVLDGVVPMLAAATDGDPATVPANRGGSDARTARPARRRRHPPPGSRRPERSLVNGALSFRSVLSLPIALDQMVPRLAATVDGSPKTKGHAGAAGVLTRIHLARH